MTPSPPAHAPPHEFSPGARTVLGVVLAAATLLAVLAQLMHGGVFADSAAQAALKPSTIALAVGTSIPLVVWWRWQVVVFVVSAVASVLLVGLGQPLDMALGPAVALFFLTADQQGVPTWPWHRVTLVAGLFVAFLVAAGLSQQGIPAVPLVHTGLVWAGAWFAGDRTRLRRNQVAELRERADRAEREVERERLLAVAEERTRIARDLHDSAGHAISVIGVRAGAARLRNDPQRSQAALEAVEEMARQTVAEIDQIVGGLRESDDDVSTPHGLASLATLVAQHRATGFDVDVAIQGARRQLRAATDQAVYRILQESLTNAARHGTGSAQVRVTLGDAAVELRVTNPVNHVGGDGGRIGHGLVGIQERVTLLAGRFEAAQANGVFVVEVCIPDERQDG